MYIIKMKSQVRKIYIYKYILNERMKIQKIENYKCHMEGSEEPYIHNSQCRYMLKSLKKMDEKRDMKFQDI